MNTDGRNEPQLQLLDTLQQYQLRNAGAEVAAAIAHAMGTPLNVISGRAELIRQDPSSALAQVTRIEEQVRKVATGLRQLVDYLAVPDEPLPLAHRSSKGGGAAEPGSAPATLQSGGVEPNQGMSAKGSSPLIVASVASVLEDLLVLARPIAVAHAAELELHASGLEHVAVDRWHVLAMLNSLLSLALHHAGDCAAAAGATRPVVELTASESASTVVFELKVPELEVLDGWHLEHFQVRPPATQKTEPYRTLSICAAIARGRGGKLQVEALPAGPGGVALIRFSCRAES